MEKVPALINQVLEEKPKPYMLNLGSGPKKKSPVYAGKHPFPEWEKWVNIDMVEYPGVDLKWDLNKPLPFPPESCKIILANDTLEHIKRCSFERVLENWYQLLMPEGKLFIWTPTLDLVAKRFMEDRIDKTDLIKSIYGYTTVGSTERVGRLESIGEVHHNITWKEELTGILEKNSMRITFVQFSDRYNMKVEAVKERRP